MTPGFPGHPASGGGRPPGPRRRSATRPGPASMTAVAAVFALLAAVCLALTTATTAHAATLPTDWTTVVGVGSGKCVDARAAATANGTAVQQYTCNGTAAQQWQFTADRAAATTRSTPSATPRQAWDVTDVSTADSALIQLWTVRRRRQPAVEAGRRGERRLPLRQPQQRQVPRRALRLHRRQRAAPAVHLQRHHGAVLHLSAAVAPPRRRPPAHPGPRAQRQRLRPVDVGRLDPDAGSTRSTPSSRPTSSAPAATPCCSSPAPTTSTSRSASTPRSPASAPRRTT